MLGNVICSEGTFYKAIDQFRYDWTKPSVAGTLEKDLFHCGFKERRIMSFSLVTSQLFSLRLHGGPVPSMLWLFKRAAMVAVG